MRRFARTVLFTCGLTICLAAPSHAYQGKTKESTDAPPAEDAAKSQPPAKAAVKTAAPRTSPKIDVKAPGVTAPRIGVTSPQVRGTAPRLDRTVPQFGGTAQPLPRGTRGNVHDPYDPAYGGTGMGVYVPLPVPQRETPEAPPAYGNVPAPAPSAPASVAIPAYDAGDAKPPAAASAKEDAPAAQPASPATGAAVPAPTPAPPPLNGRFAGMQGRTMHSWEFRADGTFEHAWAASGGNAIVEAGTYTVMGPYLTLAVWGRAASGSTAGARGSQQIRRHRLGMLGPGAGNAIMLDGLMLKPQSE